MANTEEQGVDHTPEEDRYDQDSIPNEEKPEFKDYLAAVKYRFDTQNISRALSYCVLGAAVIGLLRRRTPKRVRVDYHHYVHTTVKK